MKTKIIALVVVIMGIVVMDMFRGPGPEHLATFDHAEWYMMVSVKNADGEFMIRDAKGDGFEAKEPVLLTGDVKLEQPQRTEYSIYFATGGELYKYTTTDKAEWQMIGKQKCFSIRTKTDPLNIFNFNHYATTYKVVKCP